MVCWNQDAGTVANEENRPAVPELRPWSMNRRVSCLLFRVIIPIVFAMDTTWIRPGRCLTHLPGVGITRDPPSPWGRA